MRWVNSIPEMVIAALANDLDPFIEATRRLIAKRFPLNDVLEVLAPRRISSSDSPAVAGATHGTLWVSPARVTLRGHRVGFLAQGCHFLKPRRVD